MLVFVHQLAETGVLMLLRGACLKRTGYLNKNGTQGHSKSVASEDVSGNEKSFSRCRGRVNESEGSAFTATLRGWLEVVLHGCGKLRGCAMLRGLGVPHCWRRDSEGGQPAGSLQPFLCGAM